MKKKSNFLNTIRQHKHSGKVQTEHIIRLSSKGKSTVLPPEKPISTISDFLKNLNKPTP